MEVDGSSSKKKVHLKLVIIGSVAIGKTTFVQRYFERQFKNNSTTLGASFSLKQWGPYNIAIWDTAGEERFLGLSKFYCHGAGAAIVAFDLTDEDSFHALRAIYVPLLDAALDDCVKVVIGTKSDLLSTKPRAVKVEDATNLAREINSPRLAGQRLYFETSSMHGINVDEVFEAAFKLCVPAMDKLLDKQQDRKNSTVNVSQQPPGTPQSGGCAC